jgi:hypothetical protein
MAPTRVLTLGLLLLALAVVATHAKVEKDVTTLQIGVKVCIQHIFLLSSMALSAAVSRQHCHPHLLLCFPPAAHRNCNAV